MCVLGEYLRGGARVVDSSGDKHTTLTVDNQCSVIVADVERLGELARDDDCHVKGQRHSQALERNSSSTNHLLLYSALERGRRNFFGRENR